MTDDDDTDDKEWRPDDHKVVPLRPNAMKPSEFAQRRKELGERKDAGAKWDQDLCLLYETSGWDEAKLAEHEDIGRIYVARRILFGQFMAFVPVGTNPEIDLSAFVEMRRSLTERKFRAYWDRTNKNGNSRQRFMQIIRAMFDAPIERGTTSHKGVIADIVQKFGDGKWHAFETIVAATQRPESDVTNALGGLNGLASKKCVMYGVSKFESKPVGTTKHYRIFKSEHTVSSFELKEKLAPIIKGLQEEGAKNMATMSPGTVAKLAHNLKKLLEEWASSRR